MWFTYDFQSEWLTVNHTFLSWWKFDELTYLQPGQISYICFSWKILGIKTVKVIMKGTERNGDSFLKAVKKVSIKKPIAFQSDPVHSHPFSTSCPIWADFITIRMLNQSLNLNISFVETAVKTRIWILFFVGVVFGKIKKEGIITIKERSIEKMNIDKYFSFWNFNMQAKLKGTLRSRIVKHAIFMECLA